QPLGYLSSWPLFVVSHHFVVLISNTCCLEFSKRFCIRNVTKDLSSISIWTSYSHPYGLMAIDEKDRLK
ncbi:Mitovir_RNA_pol domain-containing protein, partial [Cephalotus follicularis]